MSTSATVYNLTKKTSWYLDYGYWLTAPVETLLTTDELYRHILKNLHIDGKLDERGQVWLEDLLQWVSRWPNNSWMVVLDISQHEFNGIFDDFKCENN